MLKDNMEVTTENILCRQFLSIPNRGINSRIGYSDKYPDTVIITEDKMTLPSTNMQYNDEEMAKFVNMTDERLMHDKRTKGLTA